MNRPRLAAILEADHNPSRGPLREFSRLVTRRRLITLLVQSRRVHQAALNEAGWAAEDAHLTISRDDDTRHEARELREALGRLPAHQARVLVLFAAGYSYDEIADREGIARKSVDSRLSRGRRTLARAE